MNRKTNDYMTPPYTPLEASDAMVAFPASVKSLMPAYSDIPREFKPDAYPQNPWSKLGAKWFFSGLRGATFVPKEGVDLQKALRHIQCILGSFEPKHEHKEAAVGYLLSLWIYRVVLDDGSTVGGKDA